MNATTERPVLTATGIAQRLAEAARPFLGGGSMAFRDGRMGVDQILAARPGAAHSLPAQRSW